MADSFTKPAWITGIVPALAGLLSYAVIAPVAAQEAGVPGVITTDAGNRVIYTADYFSQHNVVSASDQLERVPGIQGLGGGGDQRGFGSSGDQILINGKRVSGKSNDVDFVLQRIQARQVKQIEVIRGSAPGLDVRSQGRVVNVVLQDTLNTAYGSAAVTMEHYSESGPGAELELSYNGNLGAVNYLFSIEAERGKDSEVSLDRFYTPDNTLVQRQSEDSTGKTDELTLSTNTGYNFLNGNSLNLNGLYTKEDEAENELSRNELTVSGIDIANQLNRSNESWRDWEFGGDYQHILSNGNTLSTLLIYSRSSGVESGASYFMPADDVLRLEEVQREKSISIEKILRSSYQWELSGRHQFESGVEVAINSVEESASQLQSDNGAFPEQVMFNEESEIEEIRLEVFTSYSLQLSDNLMLDTSIDLEYSELKQSGGDADRTRDFFYPRPRVALRYDLSAQTQLRGRLERTISQLDFGSFISSFSSEGNRFGVITAGNPELEPEKVWVYELAYERQLLDDMGVITVVAGYSDITGHIGLIPLSITSGGVTETRAAPGNIGDGYLMNLDINGSFRLDRFRLAGGVFDLGLELQRSRVKDPFTGRKREFDASADYQWSLAFRQDLNWKSLSWGVESFVRAPQAEYDLDFWQRSEEAPDIEVFVELQPFQDITLRLEAESIHRPENRRERFVYEDNRSNSQLARRELRRSQPSREISLRLQWVF